MVDRAELRKLAGAIERPNGWYPNGVIWDVLIEALRSQTAQEDAAFIAAASPDVVLGLLDEIEAVRLANLDCVDQFYQMREERDKLNAEIEDRIKAFDICHRQAMENGQARIEAERERDQLRAVAARLKGALEGMVSIVVFDNSKTIAAREALADPEVEKL